MNAALKCQSESVELNPTSATFRCQIKSENNEATFLSSQEIVTQCDVNEVVDMSLFVQGVTGPHPRQIYQSMSLSVT